MVTKIFRRIAMSATAVLLLSSCGLSSNNNERENDYESYVDYEDSYEESGNSNTLVFRSSYDVYNYLNGKAFSGDGLTIRFGNNGHSVDVNGENLSNNVQISEIGVNDNGVAYATVRIVSPTGGTVTTLALLAVKGQAQLIDPNDGTVYEY